MSTHSAPSVPPMTGSSLTGLLDSSTNLTVLASDTASSSFSLYPFRQGLAKRSDVGKTTPGERCRTGRRVRPQFPIIAQRLFKRTLVRAQITHPKRHGASRGLAPCLSILAKRHPAGGARMEPFYFWP